MTNATLVKVPFDLARWQNVAARNTRMACPSRRATTRRSGSSMVTLVARWKRWKRLPAAFNTIKISGRMPLPLFRLPWRGCWATAGRRNRVEAASSRLGLGLTRLARLSENSGRMPLPHAS